MGVFAIRFEFNIYNGKKSVVNKKMSLDTPRVVEANFKAFTDEYNPTIVVSLEDTADFDIELLKKYFDKDHFFIKLSPINENDISIANEMGKGIIEGQNIL